MPRCGGWCRISMTKRWRWCSGWRSQAEQVLRCWDAVAIIGALASWIVCQAMLICAYLDDEAAAWARKIGAARLSRCVVAEHNPVELIM